MIGTACCIALLGSAAAMAAPEQRASEPAAAGFAKIKELVGVWRQADKPESPLRIRFSLTAGGTVVVEEWLRGDQPHSLTLYHRDNGRLMATHYCPQGNQPRLALTPANAPSVLRFAFQDATDLDVARESHLTALGFDLSQPGRIVRSETYRRDGVDEQSALLLVPE